MSGECFVHQQVISSVLGIDCYSLERWIPETLPGELAALPSPSLSEARLRAGQTEQAKQLVRLGFLRICCQANFLMELSGAGVGAPAKNAHGLRNVAGPDGLDQPQAVLRLDRTLIERHARNLCISRFSLDPLLPDDYWLELHRRSVGHALESDLTLKFIYGDSFVCFSLLPDRIFVEQLSVLTPRKGIGSALLAKVALWGRAKGFPLLEVCTECDNEGAFLFYLRSGFGVAAFFNVFHFHQGRIAPSC
jgi:GNAT superfamily N-acetyltransferase